MPAFLVCSDRGASAIRNSRFRVYVGDPWRRQVNGLSHGSALALTLFKLYTNDLSVTDSRRLSMPMTCCAFQEVHSDRRSCPPCQQWRLKPSTSSKTVTSVFHLHRNRSRRELNVHMNGQRLKHSAHAVYLGVTLDLKLSCREHVTL